MSEEQAQRLYMEYRGLTEQAERIQGYVQQVTESLGELAGTVAALEELGSVTAGSPFFAPVANGIFVEATLTQAKTVRMNVGAKVVVEKPLTEAIALLGKQRQDLETMRDRAQADLQQVALRLKAIEETIEGSQEEGE